MFPFFVPFSGAYALGLVRSKIGRLAGIKSDADRGELIRGGFHRSLSLRARGILPMGKYRLSLHRGIISRQPLACCVIFVSMEMFVLRFSNVSRKLGTCRVINKITNRYSSFRYSTLLDQFSRKNRNFFRSFQSKSYKVAMFEESSDEIP